MNENCHEHWSEALSGYLLGALEREEAAAFERHLARCERCQREVRWLAPALGALPESAERLQPPPALRERLLTEVREDARRAEGGAAAERRGALDWLRAGSGMRWRPLAAGAAALLIAAAVVGYEIGSGDSGGSGNATTIEWPQSSGIVAAVSMEGVEHGRIELTNVPSLPPGKVLEAWLERDGAVEAVPTLFVPNGEGEATTTLGNMRGVSAVMVTAEPPGGSKAPTSKPIVEVPIPRS
jgi:anti-sigma-K factor RskA